MHVVGPCCKAHCIVVTAKLQWDCVSKILFVRRYFFRHSVVCDCCHRVRRDTCKCVPVTCGVSRPPTVLDTAQ